MEPLIDSDATLKQVADTKAVLKDYRTIQLHVRRFLFVLSNVHEFFQAQRVTDLLHDKLYNQLYWLKLVIAFMNLRRRNISR